MITLASFKKVAVQNIGIPTISALVMLGGCSKNDYVAPPPLSSTALPSGTALKPFASGDPGLAKPEGMTLTSDGKVWVVLSNLDSMYSPAGPGMLAGVVPSSGATTLIDLGAGADLADGGSDDQGCLNPGVVKLDNGLLDVACTGSFTPGQTAGQSIVQADPVNGVLLHTVAAPAGIQPSAITGGPTKIWVGDTNTPTLFSVDRSTFALDDGASTSKPAVALPCSDSADNYLYVADLLADGNDLFALCSGNPDGYIVQLNATTGAAVGTAQLVGATPVAMALLGDGRLAVVNSVDETLALVTRSSTGPTVQKAVYTFAQGAALQDVKARGLFVYTVSSGTNTVQKLDLSQTVASKMLVGEVNTGDNSYPWNIEPLDDEQAVVSNNGTSVLVGVNFATGTADGGTDAGN